MQAIQDIQEAPATVGRHDLSIRFDGSVGEVAQIFVRNIILGVLTLGFHRFWGRVAIRRYLWQHIVVDGARLTYTGTARELFIGFLKFVLIFAAYIGLAGMSAHFLPEVVGQLLPFALIALLTPPTIYLARRYQLSRTRLRNISFGMAAGVIGYWRLSLWGTLLSVLTLGVMWPIFANRKHRYIIERTRWGDQHFRYTGDDYEVWKLYLRALPLLVLTVGIYGICLGAEVSRFRARHTFLHAARLEVTYTGGQVLGLAVQQLLVFFLTLGLALPYILCRNLRFFADHLRIVGRPDYGAVCAAALEGSALFEAAGGDGLGFEV